MTHEAQVSDADREAILATAADYIESWLDGDAERMGRCLHEELVKREIEHRDEGLRLDTMSRADMVAATEKGYGTRYERPYDATILEAFGDVATVSLLSSTYMDFLHVGRFDERWLIVNVLWQRRPGQ